MTTFVIETTSFAEEDIRAAIAWYEDKENGLGSKFIDDLEGLLSYIEKNPFLFPQSTIYSSGTIENFPLHRHI